MNVISISITAIFTVLAASFAIWLLVAIMDNLRTARNYRKAMGKKLSRLRLSRMLSYRGIDRDTYLHTEQVLDIEQQMERCGNCAQTERCDNALAASNNEDISGFCANSEDLQSIKSKLGSAA